MTRSLLPAAARTAVAVAATLVVAATCAVFGAPTAGAQGVPTLAVNPGVVSATQPTTVNVFGSNYLVPPHAADREVFGGVYVLFGWVQPGATWGPSNTNGNNTDGQFGWSYNYSGISRGADTRDDGTGHNRFVSFTGGGISGEATEFHMAMDPAFPDNSRGSWATTITIPGATYQYLDPRTNSLATVDCRTVQCGIYTIGAHGVKSPTNERFFPITFASGGGSTPPPAPVVTQPPAAAPNTPATAAPSGGGVTPTTAAPKGTPTTKKPTTTAKPGTAGATTTVPAAVAAETTVAADPGAETTTSEVPGDVTTTTSARTTTTSRRASGDSTESASGNVIVFGSDDDDGPGPLLWGLAVGTPVVGAAGVLLWRRRATA